MRDPAKHVLPLSVKGKGGYAEACKVLAHLIEDKDLDPEKPRSSSSQWLKTAYEEAMDAIEHPGTFLEFGPTMDSGHYT